MRTHFLGRNPTVPIYHTRRLWCMDRFVTIYHHDLSDVDNYGGPAELGSLLAIASAAMHDKDTASHQKCPRFYLNCIYNPDNHHRYHCCEYFHESVVKDSYLCDAPVQQSTTINPNLSSVNLIWDRVQLVVFFVQETILSILYILQTRKYLSKRSPLIERTWSTPSGIRGATRAQMSEQSTVLWQLIYVNIIIIALDITLLGIQSADMFQLQGAFKPCVYGIKLKIEFVILNRLRDVIQKPAASGGICLGSVPHNCYGIDP